MENDDNELKANYALGQFSGRLGCGERPALLLVDLCMAYLEPESPLYAGEGAVTAVEACKKLLHVAREQGLPIVHTRIELVTPTDGGLFRKKLPALEVFRSGNPLGDPPPGLEPRKDEIVVTKQYASAFFGTNLATSLTVMGVDSLIIGGVSTSGCVRASALDALQHGFVPLVVTDACGDRHRRPHEATLFDLSAKYADVIDLPTAIMTMKSVTAENG